MLSRRYILLCLVAVAAFGACLGCRRSHNLPGETGTVDGRVIYGSDSIPEGSSVVMLHKETGIPAVGLTDNQGRFNMRMRSGPDVLVGEYVVYIRPPGEIDDEVMQITPKTVPPAWNKVPQKYWNVASSKELYTVDPGTNFYELSLSDK